MQLLLSGMSRSRPAARPTRSPRHGWHRPPHRSPGWQLMASFAWKPWSWPLGKPRSGGPYRL